MKAQTSFPFILRVISVSHSFFFFLACDSEPGKKGSWFYCQGSKRNDLLVRRPGQKLLSVTTFAECFAVFRVCPYLAARWIADNCSSPAKWRDVKESIMSLSNSHLRLDSLSLTNDVPTLHITDLSCKCSQSRDGAVLLANTSVSFPFPFALNQTQRFLPVSQVP